MKVEAYISELLYRHDCVIVPGLGGFITNYRSAQIHPVSHTLRPPSKSISFNVQLQNNDGLLANYIAESESISYAKAQAKIDRFAQKIQNDLEHKKEAGISNVGILSKDRNGKISFEPKFTANYLLDSFGLEDIQSPAILRKAKTISLQEQVVRGSENIKSNKSSINWRVAAVIVPLIGLSAFVSLQNSTVSDKLANYAYLNPFKKKPAAVYIPRHVEKPAEKVVVLEETSTLVSPAPKAVEVKPAVTAAKMNFHLVAGCFSSKENADNLVQKLKTEGYNSSVIGQNAKGLFRVSFNSFSTRELALLEMDKIKSVGKSTWLLKQ
ncbi:MAG: SPOR domain-containing protein [Flavobacteriales bacterium]|nr:SPOR domain-containing protein [Flavobacteriales bacterium]